jgi:hypothetical protein
MQDFMFATLLFTAYFCFACCFFYAPSSSTEQLPKEPEKLKKEEKELLQVPTQPQPTAIEKAPVPEPEQEPAPETQTEAKAIASPWEDVPVEADVDEIVTTVEPVSNPQPELYAQALTVIDELGKREARKVMGGLKLQQKRNGVELSTELMIASIRREFKADPDRVIEVIRDRLPELLPATADPIQLAS